jgi:hypothetical protein
MARVVHVGFDMGIRNLAYCVLDLPATGDGCSVLAWNNIDLLEGGDAAQDAKRCCACPSPAKWISMADAKKWCQACATGVRRRKTATVRPSMPVLPPDSASVNGMRALLTTRGIDVGGKKKPELLTLIATHYLMPWKPAKTMNTSMTVLRRAMNTWLTTVLPVFAQAGLIRLENQPVMTNPTMKSVQMILFTLLGHRLETEYGWKGIIDFVHAGTKSRGMAAAEVPVATPVVDIPTAVETTTAVQTERKAYEARKKMAETDVQTILTRIGDTTWLEFFRSRTKKSDLADAFLMAYRR